MEGPVMQLMLKLEREPKNLETKVNILYILFLCGCSLQCPLFTVEVHFSLPFLNVSYSQMLDNYTSALQVTPIAQGWSSKAWMCEIIIMIKSHAPINII